MFGCLSRQRGGSGLGVQAQGGQRGARTPPALQEQGNGLELEEGTFRLDLRQKFSNPKKSRSLILWISLRVGDFSSSSGLVWVWSLHLQLQTSSQNIHPGLSSVGCWIQTRIYWIYWIYWSCPGHIHHPNTFWAPWTSPEHPLPTGSSGSWPVTTSSTDRDKEMP